MWNPGAGLEEPKEVLLNAMTNGVRKILRNNHQLSFFRDILGINPEEALGPDGRPDSVKVKSLFADIGRFFVDGGFITPPSAAQTVLLQKKYGVDAQTAQGIGALLSADISALELAMRDAVTQYSLSSRCAQRDNVIPLKFSAPPAGSPPGDEGL